MKKKAKTKRIGERPMQADLTNMLHKPNGYYSATRENMLKYIPKDVKTTLEFGCGFGGFSAMVKDRFGAETWAVEMDKEAEQQAARRFGEAGQRFGLEEQQRDIAERCETTGATIELDHQE